MAGNNEDNTILNLAHTIGSTFRDIAKTVSGKVVKTQVVALDAGGAGAEALVSTSNPLPIGLYDGAGNPLASYTHPITGESALDVHVADVHNTVINQYIHQHTATTTTLAVASSVGDYQITLADATGFSVGDYIHVNTSSIETTHPKVTAIATNTLTLDRRLDKAHLIGDEVIKVIIDMALTGQTGTMASPQIYFAGPPAGQVWHITRILFSMVHGTAGDLGLFGNLAALTNGVVVRAYVSGNYGTLTNWKTSADMKTDMFDVEFDSRSGGGGVYGTSGRGTFTRTGAVVRLDGDLGDQLQIMVQDDITALNFFGMKMQGHLEAG